MRETAVHHTPFCTRLHLEKDIAGAQPQVLLVAPMSGHFATLLRGTAQTILADHDVYISDWRNARDIGLRHGEFGFDEFIDHVTTFLQGTWPGRACRRGVPAMQPCNAAPPLARRRPSDTEQRGWRAAVATTGTPFPNLSVPARDLIFISYSHRDRDWLEHLRVFLKPYTRQNLQIWADPYIEVGGQWRATSPPPCCAAAWAFCC